jgi:hypothetical protein
MAIRTSSSSTPYLNGYSVKPATVGGTGIVTFTDGTNAVTPNQQQCEAYGYTYNKDTGTCRAFTYSTTLQNSLISEGNIIKGQDNIVMMGTGNTHIVGETNLVNGDSRNNIIVGSNNEIANGINNAAVFGNYGLAQRPGEVVIGGGGFSGTGKGYAQSSYITLTGTTTDNTATSLYVNGDSTTTIIARNGNLFTGFEATVIGVRTGGVAAGNIDDRVCFKVEGLVYNTAVDQSITTTGRFGTTTGWDAEMAFSGSDMIFEVTGATDMNISWSCTLNLYEVII